MSKALGSHLLQFLCIVQVFGIPQVPDGDCKHSCLDNGLCETKRFGDTCFYLFKKQLANWKDTEVFCSQQNLKMAQPSRDALHDGFGFDDILQELDYYNPEAGTWLGGRSRNLDRWQFIKGNGGEELIEELDVDYDGGTNYTKCGYAEYSPLHFGVQDCRELAYFICRFEYCLNQTICLGVLPVEESWFTARSHCNLGNGDLYYLKDNEDYLLNELNRTLHHSLQTNKRVHIGLVHRFWLWSDGSHILHFNWREGSPTDAEEKCVMHHGVDSKWQEENCTSTKMALCQTDERSRAKTTSSPENSASKASGYIQIIMIVFGVLLGVSLCLNGVSVVWCLCRHRNIKRKATKDQSSKSDLDVEKTIIKKKTSDIEEKLSGEIPSKNMEKPSKDTEKSSKKIQKPSKDIAKSSKGIEKSSEKIEKPSKDMEKSSKKKEKPSKDIEKSSTKIEQSNKSNITERPREPIPTIINLEPYTEPVQPNVYEPWYENQNASAEPGPLDVYDDSYESQTTYEPLNYQPLLTETKK